MLLHLGIMRHDVEHQNVFGQRRAGQPVFLRLHVERTLQRCDRGKIQRGVAPLQHSNRIEAMLLQRFDQFVVKRQAAPRSPESAILDMPARSPGDLAVFRRRQATMLPAVEFTLAGKSNVIDIEIETHADRVGCDDEIHLAVLIEFHL